MSAKYYHKNPRQITGKQFSQLREWLEELGDLSGIVHDLNSDEIVGGNQRSRVFNLDACEVVLTEQYADADEQGTVAHGYVVWQGKKYAYRQVRWNEHQCEKANIIANKAGGTFDFDVLANSFELDDLLSWGFEPYEFGLDGDEDEPEPVDDPGAQIDRAEELKKKWQVSEGQLWQLGEHRLICGDCTDAAVVERLMDGEKAQVTNTDPPYNVGREYTGATNDSRLDYEEWSRSWFNLALEHSDNIAFSCGHPNVGMWAKIEPWKWIICWFKPGAMLGSPFGFSNWEPVLFYGQAQQKGTDVINVPIVVSDDPAMKAHPVPKQVGYATKLLEMTSDLGDIVYEPFSGSGTTIIACEQLGRKCRAVEISPAYVAVALQRWADATGKTPVLVG